MSDQRPELEFHMWPFRLSARGLAAIIAGIVLVITMAILFHGAIRF